MNAKQIIDLAYQFEVASIKSGSTKPNPYRKRIIQMENGKALWEVVNLMVELYVSYCKQYEELEQLTEKYYKHCKHLEDVVWKQSGEIDGLKQQLFKSKDNPMDDLPF